MVQGIDAFGWVGLVTYFAVSKCCRPLAHCVLPTNLDLPPSPVAFVVKGVQIPVPILLSEPLLYLLVLLRLRDPPRRAHTPPIRKTLSPAPDSEVTEAWSSSQSSSRSRPQSRIGLPSSATFEEEGGLGRIEDTLTIEEDGRLRIPLDLRTAPVAGVVLLLITRTIDGSVLCQGIVGEEGVRPYDVLVLFISLVSSHLPRPPLLPDRLQPPGLYLHRTRLDWWPSRPRLLHLAKIRPRPQATCTFGRQGGERGSTLCHAVRVLVHGRRALRKRSCHTFGHGVPRILYASHGHHNADGVDVLSVHRGQYSECGPRFVKSHERAHCWRLSVFSRGQASFLILLIPGVRARLPHGLHEEHAAPLRCHVSSQSFSSTI
jgi:hypothetical protein